MKKTALFISAAAVAGGAAAAAFALKKKGGSGKKPEKKTEKAAPAEVKNAKEAVYSFVSGFKDAKMVEAAFKFDSEKFTYAVISEEFPVYTSDSHAGVLYGEDFTLQLEYADYFPGTGFAELEKHLSEKFGSCRKAVYGDRECYVYLTGDNACICLAAAEASYLLITIIKAAGNDDEISALPDNADLSAMLATLSFR